MKCHAMSKKSRKRYSKASAESNSIMQKAINVCINQGYDAMKVYLDNESERLKRKREFDEKHSKK